MVPPQLNFFTLACRDVERMAEFLRALGWPESPASEPAHRVFQLPNGVVLGLYGVENYKRQLGPRADGFRGFTLGVNVGSPEEVEAAYAAVSTVDGATDIDEPVDSPHGFTGFGFRDPEGEHLGGRLEARLARRRAGPPDLRALNALSARATSQPCGARC